MNRPDFKIHVPTADAPPTFETGAAAPTEPREQPPTPRADKFLGELLKTLETVLARLPDVEPAKMFDIILSAIDQSRHGPRLLSIEQLAERLGGMGVSTIRKMNRERLLPEPIQFKGKGGKLFWDMETIGLWLATGAKPRAEFERHRDEIQSGRPTRKRFAK
jgi:predicted DNA-binding transcriptional regulator AlpA